MSDPLAARGSLEVFQAALGYRFKDRTRLENALQHSSYAHDHEGIESNERLEFLGDSIIGLVVAHALYVARPEWNEGELTRALHSLVEGRSLAKLARSLGIGEILRLGRTERQSGGHEKDSILANAMEAVLGAMYLDGGIVVVREFVERVFAESLSADAPVVERDPKTELQERAMASHGEFPTYRLAADNEVEGDDARFKVEVLLRGQTLGEGIGRTKRGAERRAARRALKNWVDDARTEG